MLPDVTVLSFSSPLLRAVLRLDRGCFLSGLLSTGAALRGFTGWGLQRQTQGALRGEKSGIDKGGLPLSFKPPGLQDSQDLQDSCTPHTSVLVPPTIRSLPISLPHFPVKDLAFDRVSRGYPINFYPSLCYGYPPPTIFSFLLFCTFFRGDQLSRYPSFPRTVGILRMWRISH